MHTLNNAKLLLFKLPRQKQIFLVQHKQPLSLVSNIV